MDFKEFIQDKANKLALLDWPNDMILCFIDGAEQTNNYFGWHPASELPPVGENGNSVDVIAIDEDNEPIKVSYSKFYKCWVMADVPAESFDKITIKCWCYPPKEE